MFDSVIKGKNDKDENFDYKKYKDNLNGDKISHFHSNNKSEKLHGSKKSLGKYYNDKVIEEERK